MTLLAEAVVATPTYLFSYLNMSQVKYDMQTELLCEIGLD